MYIQNRSRKNHWNECTRQYSNFPDGQTDPELQKARPRIYKMPEQSYSSVTRDQCLGLTLGGLRLSIILVQNQVHGYLNKGISAACSRKGGSNKPNISTFSKTAGESLRNSDSGIPMNSTKVPHSKGIPLCLQFKYQVRQRWAWLRNLSWSAEPLPCLIWINNSLKDNQFGSHTCPVAELGSISAHALPCPAPAADGGTELSPSLPHQAGPDTKCLRLRH